MKSINRRDTRGFSLLEVMIAVVVLAFGLVSLAALQGRLFQAGAESKARATASALAQGVIEEARAFPYSTAPAGYLGPTYEALATWDTLEEKVVVSGGVEYRLARGITRYRPDGTIATGSFNPALPEFKVVDVTAKWTGADGLEKTVELKDSISSLAAADAFNVMKSSTAMEPGPAVWIEPPNKDNPAVVPIAVGDDQSAASSNPVPRRFTKEDSNTAATIFNVHTFSGSASGEEVLLNRKLDVAAVTCKCSGVGVSSAANPAYEPVIWNGKQLAYMDPRPLPSGTKIGTYSGGQASKDIDEMCTTCCRDHHESTSRLQRPDPYRALPNALFPSEAFGSEHYLVTTNKGAPNTPIFNGPLPSGEYSEACQIIRVNGRSRLAIDPRQSMLVTVPMNSLKTSQEVFSDADLVNPQPEGTFARLYSEVVVKFISSGAAAVKTMTGYLSPDWRFPQFNEADYLTPPADPLSNEPVARNILQPAPVVLKTTKDYVSFGLYVDYLSPETLNAYDCALNKATNTSDRSCDGLRDRNPLETLPFYAINVANLGLWKADASMFPSPNNGPTVVVSSPSASDFDNKGIFTGSGGVVTALSPKSPAPCTKVSVGITRSSSGIAGRLPIDKDDNSVSNLNGDSLWFTLNPDLNTNSKCVDLQGK